MSPNASVLVLARDLLISSRITSAAKRLGVGACLIRQPSALAQAPAAGLLIVDLDLEGAITGSVEWGRARQRPVVGFVQHVHAHVIREAHQAGIERIIPRSRLESALPELFKSLAA